MASLLNAQTARFLDDLKKKRLITPIERVLLPSPQTGWIILSCADGDRFGDLFDHHRRTCVDGDRCLHPFTCHGGAIALPRHSPLAVSGKRQASVTDFMLDHIQAATEIKGLDKVALYFHFPCAAIGRAGLSEQEVVHLAVEAKQLIKAEVPAVKQVVSFVHVDSGTDKRTYKLHLKKIIAEPAIFPSLNLEAGAMATA